MTDNRVKNIASAPITKVTITPPSADSLSGHRVRVEFSILGEVGKFYSTLTEFLTGFITVRQTGIAREGYTRTNSFTLSNEHRYVLGTESGYPITDFVLEYKTHHTFQNTLKHVSEILDLLKEYNA